MTVTLQGVSNKHCLLSLFSLVQKISVAFLFLLLIEDSRLMALLINCVGGWPRNSVARITDPTRNHLKCLRGS